MPPGDMDAARRLAIVFTDPPSGFPAPAGGIGLALCRVLPELQIELVPSGIGAMYARFRTHHEREMSIEHGDIFYDDVHIFLGREETAARAPQRNYKCALIWASPFPAEHVNPLGIRMAFAKVGQLLEIDPLCLIGTDLAAVCAVVALEDPALVPNVCGPSSLRWTSGSLRWSWFVSGPTQTRSLTACTSISLPRRRHPLPPQPPPPPRLPCWVPPRCTSTALWLRLRGQEPFL
jgi:hypothetical protein